MPLEFWDYAVTNADPCAAVPITYHLPSSSLPKPVPPFHLLESDNRDQLPVQW